jgi:hypothetical protein
MVHRTRTTYETMVVLWLALTAAAVVVALLARQGLHGFASFPGAAGALAGGVLSGLATGAGHLPEPGTLLASVAQTRRATARWLWIFVPLMAGATVVAVLADVAWAAPAIALAGAVSGGVVLGRVERWERRHPDVLLAQDLRWLRSEHRVRWARAWGDRAPDVIEPEATGATLPPSWLEAAGFWPSKNPDDYR